MSAVLSVETLSGEDSARYRDDVLHVWSAVFGAVENSDEWTSSLWDRHRTRAGFRLTLARERGQLLGFAWGYTGERGQYWPDLISREMGSRVDGWIGGHFEFVELAVIPEARQRGIGALLHDALLAAVPHARALLATTDHIDDPAVRLYRSRGWVSLGTYGEGRQVMALTLGSQAAQKS